MLCLQIFNFVSCVILLSITFDVVQSRFVYKPDIQREIKQDKVVATWQEAKEHCESQGAILASPIDSAHLNYMRSYIEVNDHTAAYFTGYKAVMHDDDLNYISVEGFFLDDLPDAVVNMIEKIDPEDGDCLSMDRHEIRAVPCWERLPYICYTKVTNVISHVPTEVSSIVPMDMTSNVSIESFSSEPVNFFIELEDVTTDENDLMRRILLIPKETSSNFPGLPIENTEVTNVTSHVPTEVSSIVPVDMTSDISIESSSSEPVEVTTELVDVITETSSNFPDLPIENTEVAIDVPMNNADVEEGLGSGYSYYDTGSLYKLHDTPLSWTNANATCAREGGYLAVINDAAELRVLLELGDIEPHVLWIGLKKIDGDWRSVQDDNVEDIYNRWSVNLMNDTCGLIINTGLLDDRDCETKFPFICEKSVVPIEAEA